MLVIGAGSIGARHVANLMAAGAHVTVTDPDAERARSASADGVAPFDLDAIDGYDGIVVASPTRFHLDQARAAVSTGVAVMVEKPLADRAEGVDELVRDAGDRLMVGYNLRLHAPIERLVALVEQGRVGTPLAHRLWFGSWLPDWRPNVDYRSTYSARADLGGGVLNDAIHELDLAVWLAGADLTVVGAVVERLGPLEIDVEDTVRALLRTPDGIPVEIALDYLSRTYRRGIEVTGDQGTIRLDWARSCLEIEGADGNEVEPVKSRVDESYEREAASFLRLVRGEGQAPVDGATGLASLRLADAIRVAGRATSAPNAQPS